MKLNIQEIRKQSEGLHFEQMLDLAADLRARNQEILDVKDILAVGKVQYEDRMYFLDYQLSYTIVLASSRSMEPVELVESYPVTEVFMEGATNQLDQEVLDDDLVLPIENGELDLAESVSDNILLNIPIKVLTAEEEAGQGFVSGNDWQIMTEEEYQAQQAVKKEGKTVLLLAYKDYLMETNNGLVKKTRTKGATRNHCSFSRCQAQS